MSEITERTVEGIEPRAGWILYDGRCGLCSEAVGRYGAFLKGLGYGVAPLQSAWLAGRLGRMPDCKDVLLLRADNRILPGVDVYLDIFGRVPWTAGLAWVGKRRIVHRILAEVYRWLADHRTRISRACRMRGSWA